MTVEEVEREKRREQRKLERSHKSQDSQEAVYQPRTSLEELVDKVYTFDELKVWRCMFIYYGWKVFVGCIQNSVFKIQKMSPCVYIY